MDWGFVLLAYLMGSVPTGILVSRAYGTDIRASGSGNIGATNALRVLGKKAGALTLAGDMLKGVVPVLLALHFSGREAGILAAGAAVIGHDFSVFTGFKGGKGVATSLGVVLALSPITGAICVGVWLGAFLISRISSVGALAGFAALPVITYIRDDGRMVLPLAVFLTALIFIKHRENIKRLVSGEESRISRKA